MTPSTITTGIRISPQLWAEFNLWAKKNGKTRNHALVDLIRGVCVGERREGGK